MTKLHNVDIDRLHHCVQAILSHKPLRRAEGATTAHLALLVGDIELGDPTNIYVYVGENSIVCDIVKRDLTEILYHYGYRLSHATQQRITIDGNTIVRFISADQFFNSYSLRGLKIARVYFDVSQHTLARYDQEQIDYAIVSVKATGAEFV